MLGRVSPYAFCSGRTLIYGLQSRPLDGWCHSDLICEPSLFGWWALGFGSQTLVFYSLGKLMLKSMAFRIASATVSSSTFSNLRIASRTVVGGPLSSSVRGGGLKSNMSSILVAHENMT